MHTNLKMPEPVREAGSVPLSKLSEASQTLINGNTVASPVMSLPGMLPLH